MSSTRRSTRRRQQRQPRFGIILYDPRNGRRARARARVPAAAPAAAAAPVAAAAAAPAAVAPPARVSAAPDAAARVSAAADAAASAHALVQAKARLVLRNGDFSVVLFTHHLCRTLLLLTHAMTRAVPDATRPCLRRVVSFLRPNGVLIGAAAGGVLSLQDTHYTRRTAATHCCCYRIKKDDILQVYVDAVTHNVVKVEWTDTEEMQHGPCVR